MNELHYQIDLLKAMNQKLSEKERMYQRVSESAEGAYLYCSLEKNQVVTLGQWNDFFPFEIREMRDFERLLEAVDEPYQGELRDRLYLEKTGEETGSIECKLRDKKKWFKFRVKVSYDPGGVPEDKVIYITDTSKLHAQNEELTYMAYYDALTGLYNRNYFVRLLGEYIRNASENNSVVSVMIIDIDEFRNVNDVLGIVVGDELLQQLGFFLKELCAANSIACHLHRDVFGIAIYSPTASCSVESVYAEIRKRLKEPFRLSTGETISIRVCVGVAEYPEAATSALELINCAEIMLFKSKVAGARNIQYFTAADHESFVQSVALEDKLKKAIYNRNFIMYYQPQYYSGNKRLRGVEALVRWKDEETGLISPATFIPVAEKNGCIIPLGKWVVEESVRQYAAWRKQFGFPFILSINISALQYKKDDFVDSIVEVLNKYQVKSSEVELEITESVLIDDFQAVYDKLTVLRNYGVRVSLDDFGTGFSSLSYLKKLPIDTLKIDKTFIDTVMTDSATRVITESIIHMVRSLGFESIAEGVENEQQYQYLHAIGCDVIQGYLFSKPLPPKELEELLCRNK